MGHVPKTLAPDLPRASKETKGKPGAPMPQFLHQLRVWPDHPLVASKIPFLSSSRILDPSVPRQTLTLPCIPHCWNEGKARYRVLHSQTEVLLKYCLRFLDKSSAYPPSWTRLVFQIPDTVSPIDLLLWVQFNYFSAKWNSLHSPFLSTYPLEVLFLSITLSLLPFWIPGVYN